MPRQEKYLLDTCVCIALIKNEPNVVEHIRRVGVDACYISDITIGELYFGAYKSGREKHFEDVELIKKLFLQISTTDCMKKYGQIRWDLERSGKRIDNLDLLIGVTALQEGLILVTGNVKHFERISDLQVENWMEN